MAVPALAPAAAVFGLETVAGVTARAAGSALQEAPLVFPQKLPYIRVGDNWATRAGRRAHAEITARARAKDGWDADIGVRTDSGRKLRPDILAPARGANPDRRLLMELKPNTPTGRKAGERAAKVYNQETGNRTRVIYYSPKDYM